MVEYNLPRLKWRGQKDEKEETTSGMFKVAKFLAERCDMVGETDLEKSLAETLVDYIGKYYERKLPCITCLTFLDFKIPNDNGNNN